MTDVTRWGNDLGASGYYPAEDGTGLGNKIRQSLIATLTQLAASPVLNGKVQTQVLLVGSYAYVTTVDGTFYKLDKDTLAVVGTYAIGNACHSCPHITGGYAYFGDDAGYLHKVNISTMAVSWKVGPFEGAIANHPVVSGTKVYFGAASTLRAHLISDGSEAWNTAIIIATGGAVLGAVAFYDGDPFFATGGGVYRLAAAAGTIVTIYGARNQASSVAIQTDTSSGQTYLCFESLDQWFYAYDADTGDRIWIEGHQGGDAKSPVGLALDIGVGFAVIGTHNWSIQPHNAPGGDMQWKRDATAGSAIVTGFAITASGVLAGVWPHNDGRLVVWGKIDDTPGGHVPDWKVGTSTGIGGGPSSANKFELCTPMFANHRLYCGAGDKKVYCFS